MGKRTKDIEFSEWGKSLFGFSGSDIAKSMQAIVNAAADRALPLCKNVQAVRRKRDGR
jgi:hypothetical protein